MRGLSEAPFRERIRRVTAIFDKEGEVYETLLRLVRRLESERIDYAIIGGIALLAHGYRRATMNVDALITEAGLAVFHSHVEARGYDPAFEGAQRTFLDRDTGVRVRFMISGTFPGDGEPKRVAFPEPRSASVDHDGYRVISLPKLIEIKIAAGGAPRRRRDLADVQALIEAIDLPRALAEELDESVRASFDELWTLAQMPDFHNQGRQNS